MSVSLENISDALRRQDWIGAAGLCRGLLQQVPDCAPAHYALGLTYCAQSDYARAVEPLERAQRLDDRVRVDWSRNLGAVYSALGRWADAVRVLEPIANDLDESALACYLAAAAECGHAAHAVELMQPLRARIDERVALLCEYGRLLLAAKHTADAEAALHACLARDPDCTRAHEALATLYHENGRGDLACDHCEQFARLEPHSGAARLQLALAYSMRGRVDESRTARQAAVALGLPVAADRSTDVRLRMFDEREDAASILAACREVFRPARAASAAPPALATHARRRRSRGSRLRIGYLSGEYHLTPAYYFLTPFLLHHDRSAVELFLYHSSTIRDDRTPAYERVSDHWRDVARMPDEALLAMLRQDELDVLVDLSGHFPRNRLSVFPHRPARVHATFPNFPSTTGCPGVDYFFTDAWTSPVGSEAEYSERLHRLPAGYLVYAPPENAPPLTPLPVHRRGHVTIGVFQRLAKITSQMWDLFAAVLRRLPETTTLLLHNSDLSIDRAETPTARFLHAQLRDRGVDPARLRCVGGLQMPEHLHQIAAVDLVLDTTPYNGQTTTCECLWMGVPTVTLSASTHVSRVAPALLMRAGLGELVTHTPESYVDVACRLASDIDALQRYRFSLRQRMIDAGLTDGVALARGMEDAYRAWVHQA